MLLVFSVGLNHGLNQWFKPNGLNQANPANQISKKGQNHILTQVSAG